MKFYQWLRTGRLWFSILAGCGGAAPLSAQGLPPQNSDEEQVHMAPLPDALVLANGTRVTTAETWTRERRPELLELFRTQMYGRAPEKPAGMTFETRGLEPAALGGLATRKEITVFLTGRKDGPMMTILLYVPNAAPKPAPAFLGLNFYGNQSVDADPGITRSTGWMMANDKLGIANHRATEKTCGAQASRWQVEKILKRGYATATVYYGDIEPDHPEGWKTGIRAALSKDGAETRWKDDEWSAIAAWAWGLSRAMDYLETDKDIDAKHVAVHGHSRLGKTALWAGATDERFALTISNNSGEGGAALARRDFGETTAIINRANPHWFCRNFHRYSDNPAGLPVDQHELIALMAPRPVYVASAEQDKWADPRGEFLAAKNAGPVYALFGKTGIDLAEPPPVNQPAGDFIGYHIRTGEHDITAYDWERFLDFADRHFKQPH